MQLIQLVGLCAQVFRLPTAEPSVMEITPIHIWNAYKKSLQMSYILGEIQWFLALIWHDISWMIAAQSEVET